MLSANALLKRFESIRLQKDAPSPIYQQIAHAVEELIASGALPPDSPLPPERVLCETYGISRMTVRQAIRMLVDDGLVEAHRGRGTFVAANRIRKQQQEMRSFTEEIRSRGGVPESRLLSFALQPPDATAQAFFGLEAGEDIYEVCRLRLNSGVPLAVESVRVARRLCPQLDRFDLSRNSLYMIFEESYGLRLEHCVEEISAGLPSPTERKLLEIPKNTAALIVYRKTYAESGQALELARAVYRGDRYSAIVRSIRKPRPIQKNISVT